MKSKFASLKEIDGKEYIRQKSARDLAEIERKAAKKKTERDNAKELAEMEKKEAKKKREKELKEMLKFKLPG